MSTGGLLEYINGVGNPSKAYRGTKRMQVITSHVELGNRLVAIAPIDFGPYGLVAVGDRGTVTHADKVSGEIQILLDRTVYEMRDWENTITLMLDESCDHMWQCFARVPSYGTAYLQEVLTAAASALVFVV